MLFNSYTFIFAFLPVTLLVFAVLVNRMPRRVAVAWLVVASLFFYGWARPENLWLLGALLVGNYAVGVYLGHHQGTRWGRIVLALGLVANLGALGYYKYTNFIVKVANASLGTHWPAAEIVLPLGISFFVFQKLAYLVDAYRGQTRGYHFVDYCLFVTFFPQLIAGPIVHHSEVVPQFARRTGQPLSAGDVCVGLTQFLCGLFKKVVVADRLALFASPVFDAAAAGAAPTLLDGWIAALAYSFQLYFDFSGYSDMALGLGRLFGIRLPLNFNSPYKAVNIVDFWRRWHMTLSRFLRDYLYIPLGGNRRGATRRQVNLLLTMLLGGLWHGAGWTFVLWGGLHGVYLVVNHAWAAWQQKKSPGGLAPPARGSWNGRALTFFVVVLAWVFFRSADFPTAWRMLAAMFGAHGLGWHSSLPVSTALLWLAAVGAAVWCLPNTQQILGHFQPTLASAADLETTPGGSEEGVLARRLKWRPTVAWAVIMAGAAIFVISQMSRVSEFIYWQF